MYVYIYIYLFLFGWGGVYRGNGKENGNYNILMEVIPSFGQQKGGLTMRTQEGISLPMQIVALTHE